MTTHGMSKTREYRAWADMIGRCEQQSDPRYSVYGARGIKVCEQWRRSFEAFYADLGPRPSPEHSLDRIDNDGNYEPRNCRWATRSEQQRNTSRIRPLTFNGTTKLLTDWAKELGLHESILIYRLDAGWPMERVLSQEKFSTHGETHSRAKLSEENVRQIRAAHIDGSSIASLARRFGVSPATAGCIIRGKSWKHVKEVCGAQA